MRIVSVEITGYRCISHLVLSLDPFSALIGSNGTGKSAVLHALDWFFNGGKVDEYDFHIALDSTVSTEFSVSVKFTDLSPALSARWSRYVRSGDLELRRTATNAGRDQLSGLHRQGPNFSSVRLATDTMQRRAAYKALRASLPALPAVLARQKIEEALEAWENDPANDSALVEVPDSDLTNAFGFYGKQLLTEAMQFVLVPASTRLEENVDPSGRGGAIDTLLGSVVRAAAEKEVETWSVANAQTVGRLAASIGSAVKSASRAQMDSTNAYLSEMIAGGKVAIHAQTAPPRIKPDIALTATFEFEGSSLPISKQGHGVQRSVMMAALQAAADIGASGALSSVLAIEEPELYQHPARSMALSRALAKLVQSGSWQVAVATHSPAMLRPESVASVRRFAVVSGKVAVIEGSAGVFAATLGTTEQLIRKHLEHLLPTEFSSALFSERVMLVEGGTDRIVLGRVLELAGHDVDASNWSIVSCEGKQNIAVAAAILVSLGIDTRVVFDADCREDKDDARHKQETEKVLSELRKIALLNSSDAFTFGDETSAFAKVAILRRDIESEELLWPSFMAEMEKHTGDSAVTTKNPYLVRMAASSAAFGDCPASLISVAKVLAT